MTDIVKAARDRIAVLRQEIEELENFLEASARVTAMLAFDYTADSSGDESSPPVDQPRTRVTDNPKPADVVGESIIILLEQKRPMTRRELHVALKERGLEVKGADPIKALGTMLWRGRDHLRQIEGRGYWPKGVDVPPLDIGELL